MYTTLSDRLSILSPIVSLYGVLAILIIFLRQQLVGWGVDVRVLHGANTILFLAAAFASIWVTIQFRHANGQSMLKALYGGFMIRFFLIALTAFVYILMKRKQVNVPGLVGGAIFYVLYMVLEIQTLRAKLKHPSTNA
ncbi:MAG: hypothetical protein ACKO6Q_01505 [Bacteroidota bacterium]